MDDENERERRIGRDIGVGCLTGVAGFFSGAMFAVLIAKIVGAVRDCPAGPSGQPCDWHVYAGIGGLIGMITLPSVALWRLRRTDGPTRNSERG
jgi:hypothetical protein